MKKTFAILLTVCMLLSLLPLSASAKTPDISYELSYDVKYDLTHIDNSVSLMSEGVAIPAAYDARDNGWVTPLKSQGTTGACWAYSIMSNFETYNISQKTDDVDADYSEAHLVWSSLTASADMSDPTYGDSSVTSNPYDDGGNFNTAVGALAKWSGIADEKDFPMSEDRTLFDDSDRYNTGSGYVIKSAEHLLNSNAVKEWIMKYGSVTVDFYCMTDYCYVSLNDQNDPDATHIAFWNYENVGVNHKVTIIGWHDSFPMTQAFDYSESGQEDLMPPADGAWLCKDSNGIYCWLSYYDPTICNATAYTSQSTDLYRNNYTYNGAGYVVGARMTNDVSLANVFTAKENEILSAVSTYTLTPNQKLDISIYKNMKSNYSNPTQGTLALEYETTVQNAGYHTIELPEDVLLTPDEIFSVVIKVQTVNRYADFPVEKNSSDVSAIGFTYSSKTKQSYINTGTGWYTSEAYGLCNVFIQAFTSCNHQVSTSKADPTAEKDGYVYSVCSQCSEVFEDETLPAYGFVANNGAVIDYQNKTIYGLAAGIKSLDDYTDIVLDSYHWEYEPSKFGFGTGTKAIMKNGDTVVDEYTLLIFGDANGDGWYDGEDAFLVNLIVEGLLTEDKLSPVIWKAADCNHDGSIDETDVELLTNAGLKKNDIDQSAAPAELQTQAAYIEYSSLISQLNDENKNNIEIPNESNPEKNTPLDEIPSKTPTYTLNLTNLLMTIINFIIKLFSFITF